MLHFLIKKFICHIAQLVHTMMMRFAFFAIFAQSSIEDKITFQLTHLKSLKP